jgi:hypothetical protein
MNMPFDINTIADIVRPHHDKLIAEGKANKLERENARLREALLSCEKYFDDHADVLDGDYGVPAPNTEMRLLSEVRSALLGGSR